MKIRSILLAATLCLSCAVATPARAVVALPNTYFVNLKDGDAVTSPVHIQFGVNGIKVAPAGTHEPGTGHFHLLIDADDITLEEAELPIPADEHHIHYGKGQTEATVELSPGPHTLQLVMGDGNHVPLHTYTPKITITVTGVLASSPASGTAPTDNQEQDKDKNKTTPAGE